MSMSFPDLGRLPPIFASWHWYHLDCRSRVSNALFFPMTVSDWRPNPRTLQRDRAFCAIGPPLGTGCSAWPSWAPSFLSTNRKTLGSQPRCCKVPSWCDSAATSSDTSSKSSREDYARLRSLDWRRSLSD